MPGSGTSRTALLLVALAVIIGIAALVTSTGSVRSPAMATVAGGLLGVAVIFRASDTPLGTAIASAIVPLVGVLAVATAGISVLDASAVAAASGGSSAGMPGNLRFVVRHLGVTIGAGLGAFGTVGTLRDGIGDGAVGQLCRSIVAMLAVIGTALVVILAPSHEAILRLPVAAMNLSPFVDPLFSPNDPGITLLTFWVLGTVAVWSAKAALNRLPILALASRSRRERMSSLVEQIDGVLWGGVRFCLLFVVATSLLLIGADTTAMFEAVPVAREVVTALEAPVLRVFLLSAIAVLAGITLFIQVIKCTTGSVASAIRAHLPAAFGGILAILIAVIAAPLVGKVRSRLPEGFNESVGTFVESYSPVGVVLAAVAVAVFLLLLALTVIALGGALGYVPSRSAGGAIAAAGLVVGALSVGATRGSAVVVFFVVALSLLAWDVNEYGVTIRAELKNPATRTETVHAVGSLAVAALGVGVAWGFYGILLGAVAVPNGSLAGAIGTIVAVLLLLGMLRG